ncbi:MAG TPA: hypothetical protein VLY20_10320 [Nitrospiria bacterium]|nr:hypothetical protein [Nitrospiria bacterium]
MFPWSRVKEDLYNGIVRVRNGFRSAAVASSEETDRLKHRYRLRAVERQLADAYRALGQHGLTQLKAGRPVVLKEKEGLHLIQEIEAKRAERETLVAEGDAFTRDDRERDARS